MNDKIVTSIAEYLEEEESRLLDPWEVSQQGFIFPDFDDIDKSLLFAIEHDPAAAIANGLMCPVTDLLSYVPYSGTLTAKVTNLYTSRYFHLFRRWRDGFELLQPRIIVAEDRPEHDYVGWAIDGYGDVFATNEERSKGSILLHTLAYFPGFELPRAWSKMFDAERNKRDNGLHDFVYYPKDGGKSQLRRLHVDSDGYTCMKPINGFGDGYKVNHVVDHIYGNTDTLQPGFRAALQLRPVLPDVNKDNKHTAHAVGDFLCFGDFTGYQPDHFDGNWDKLIKDGWVHMMKQALTIQPVGGFHLEDPARWCLALSK